MYHGAQVRGAETICKFTHASQRRFVKKEDEELLRDALGLA
jgi:hypothetical protein